MRLFPMISALLVGIFLYVFVMDRDLLRAMAGAGDSEAAAVQEDAAPQETPAVAVVARKSIARDIESGIVLRGRTEANRRVEVRSEITGLVVSEPLRRGTMVNKGDLLCQIDPGTRPAQLAEAQALYQEAEATNRASESLVERGFTAETVAIGNRAKLQSALAAIERAQSEIDRLQIFAPFGGLLESDTAEIGSLLQPGSECATIVDLDPIKLIGFVPERSVNQIVPGAKVGARLLTGQEFTGTVSFVAHSGDEVTRTFRVEADVPNPDLEIRDGITAEIFVSLDGTRGHLVPQSALTLNDDGELGLRTVDGETTRFVPVKVVRDSVEGVWVTGPDDEVGVIVVGQDFVTDGQAISVTWREVEE